MERLKHEYLQRRGGGGQLAHAIARGAQSARRRGRPIPVRSERSLKVRTAWSDTSRVCTAAAAGWATAATAATVSRKWLLW